MSETEITDAKVDVFYTRLKAEAEAAGYHLNPDIAFTKELLKGLLLNERRYGFPVCPCRLASGIEEEDCDINCPCDCRDTDLQEYGQCYCGLYVSEEIVKGLKPCCSIPERRVTKKAVGGSVRPSMSSSTLPFPVWRCRVCGYLCARGEPPPACPICKARKERFDRFM